jgi:ABC-type ATPase with predicted acetyltransferase domain
MHDLHLLNEPSASISRRCATVATWFGIDPSRDARAAAPRVAPQALEQLIPRPGRITLICGPSGSGKTSLLRQLRAALDCSGRWINLPMIRLSDRPLVDCFARTSIAGSLELLSRVGLGEAWSYFKRPSQLSDGQRWRLRLALAMRRAQCRRGEGEDRPIALVCDEFAALLDRVTAAVVARALRRFISSGAAEGLGAIVATSHEDLLPALSPDVIARCDFNSCAVQAAPLPRA